jgi:MFS family permease
LTTLGDKSAAVPDDLRTQIRLYYLNMALIGTWFTSGIALFFNRLFLTDTTIGLLETLAFGVGLLAEIPSGTIADRFGRRRTVMLGVVVSGVGFAVWGLAMAGWMVVVGVLLFALGTALQSGADEAMMYDYLKAHGQAHLWQRVSANCGIIARCGYVVALVVGGIAYIADDRLPFVLRAMTFFLMLIPLARLAVIDRFQEGPQGGGEPTHFGRDFRDGIRELLGANVRWLVPLYLMVQGVSYTVFTAGILRPLLYEKSGLAVVYHSFAISLALAATVIAMFAVRRLRTTTAAPIYVFTVACATGFATTIGNLPMALALVGLTVVQVASYTLMPLLSTALNAAISSRTRATTISTANFMQSILYVVAAPAVGWLSYNGHINTVAIGATLAVVVGIALSLVLRRG